MYNRTMSKIQDRAISKQEKYIVPDVVLKGTPEMKKAWNDWLAKYNITFTFYECKPPNALKD